MHPIPHSPDAPVTDFFTSRLNEDKFFVPLFVILEVVTERDKRDRSITHAHNKGKTEMLIHNHVWPFLEKLIISSLNNTSFILVFDIFCKSDKLTNSTYFLKFLHCY